MVTPLQHAGALECSRWEAPFPHPVRQGDGKEAEVAGGGGTTGELREVLSGLRETIVDHDIFQVYGEGVDGRG